jgi:hypothetical protein
MGATLGDAILHGANLSNADLDVANLKEAKLQGANLKVGSLLGADISGAQFTQMTDWKKIRVELEGEIYEGDLRAKALKRIATAEKCAAVECNIVVTVDKLPEYVRFDPSEPSLKHLCEKI